MVTIKLQINDSFINNKSLRLFFKNKKKHFNNNISLIINKNKDKIKQNSYNKLRWLKNRPYQGQGN
jgi:hypothetical protein